MADIQGEKKHAPTPRRRQQAREEGRVANSQDLTSAILLLLAIATLWMFGGTASTHLGNMMMENIATATIGPFDTGDATAMLARSAVGLGIVVVPMLAALFLMSILINVTQTGLLFVPSKLSPSLENIDPVQGAKRMVSMRSLVRLLLGIFKMLAIVVVFCFAVRHYGARLMQIGELSLPQITQAIVDCVLGTCVWIGATLLGLALMDYALQRLRLEKELMMTDDELREELRETNGDPQISDRQRQIQSSRSDAPAADITAADVIVTSPSGVAIAIKYNPMTMNAPQVIGKARGRAGERMLNAAAQHDVSSVEDALLAEHQFRETAIGDEVSADQYPAVARIFRSIAA